MDDGYWDALLRDVEEELRCARGRRRRSGEGGSGASGGGASALARHSRARTAKQTGSGRNRSLPSGEPTDVRRSAGSTAVDCWPISALLQGFIPASHLLTPLPGQSPEQRAAALGRTNRRYADGARRGDRPESLPADPLRAPGAGQRNEAELSGQPPAGPGARRPGDQPVPVRRLCGPGRLRRPDPYLRAILGPGRHRRAKSCSRAISVRPAGAGSEPRRAEGRAQPEAAAPDPWQGVDDRYSHRPDRGGGHHECRQLRCVRPAGGRASKG